MTTTHFITELPSLARFRDIADPTRFVPAPDDWRLYTCDIVDSSGAIAAGRYKAVNMAGAASIIAAVNAAPGVDLAYAFGGDGAAILAPDALAPAIDRALDRTRRLVRDRFLLEMRVGAVPVPELRARGVDLAVAMLTLSPGNRLAMFSGGGVALADTLMKTDEAGRWRIPENDDDAPPDLTGLSCRWEPLAAQNGMVLSLLVVTAAEKSAAERARILDEIIASIDGIFGPDADAARPVRESTLRFRWPPRGLGLEALATSGRWLRWLRILKIAGQSLAQKIADWGRLTIGGYSADRYRRALSANADFRKFDDVLRLVLDVTSEQRRAIESLLTERHRLGEIFYGIHVSDRALMTCMLLDLDGSRHLHLIDGADGGFALAARALKAQMAT